MNKIKETVERLRYRWWLAKIDRYIASMEDYTVGGLIPDSQVTIVGLDNNRTYTFAQLKAWRKTLDPASK